MPIVRRVDDSTGVLWTTVQGDVTAADIRQHLDAVREMRGQRYYEVIDTRGATARFGARDLQKLAQHGRSLLADAPMAPRAIVVDRTNLVSFGTARLFASLASAWVTMRVFDSLSAAEAYIDAVLAASA
jgi:hypothetical protein